MSTIPTRHSEKAIERYRPFIESVSVNYPTPIVIDPSPLSPDTFACRFRDAVAGILRYGSGEDLLDEVLVWSQDYMVATLKGSGHLVIGRTSEVKTSMKQTGPIGKVIDASISPVSAVSSPSDRVLDALLVLMDHHILEFVTLNGVDESTILNKLPQFKRTIEVMNQNGTITLL